MSELRQLDLDVAEQVMGFDRMNARVDPMVRNGDPQYFMGYPVGHDFAPYYSIDIAAAFQVEDRIAELGLQRQYIIALRGETRAQMIAAACGYEWKLVHASPEQRCRAALECVKEKAKSG